MEVNYVSAEEFDATVAAMQARVQAARLKRFAGKRERSFTVRVLVAEPYTARVRFETRTIRGFTLADAKEQAGIV